MPGPDELDDHLARPAHDDLEARARDVLEASAYAYYSSGAEDELSLAGNVEAWRRRRLRPRVLRDVSAVRTDTTVLGHAVAAPVVVAPFAWQGLLHPGAEPDTARAAAAAGTIMCLSTFATSEPAEVGAACAGGPWWFQVYVMRDRGFTRALVEEAVAAGARALVLTVDAPFRPRWPRAIAAGFVVPDVSFVARRAATRTPPLELDGGGADQSPALTFADIAWLHEISGLPVVVKGVLRGDDALACAEAGAAAVVVSNHGGRQLDRAMATADALPEVAAAVADRAEVYVDGGIRSGTDVLLALALGARAVLVGRPLAWGLATGGAEGVSTALATLHEQLAFAMAMAGVRSVDEATADLVAEP